MDHRERHRAQYPPGRLARAALLVVLGLGLAACDGALDGVLPDANNDAASATSDATASEGSAPGGADEAATEPDAEAAIDVRGDSADAADAEATDATDATEDTDAAALGVASDAEAGAQPGDMLSALEAEDAAQMALESAFVEDVVALAVDRDAVLSGQTGDMSIDAEDEETRVLALAQRPSYRVIYSERYSGKDADKRAAQVAIYRYDTQQALFAKVDLESGDVEPMALPDGSPVPLVPEETQEAAVVALADPAVRDRLAAAGIDAASARANGLLTTTDDASSSCATSRCIRLFFGTLERPVPEFSVVVDLVALTVVEVADMPGRSLNP